MAKPSAEQVTRCLNAIYDSITYRREIDYFRFRDNNQNLNVGSGVPWLTLEAVKLTHRLHMSNNGSCLWSMLANTLTDFYPNWREHIGGSYMVYSPKIWNMYQEAAVEYFKITNHVHFMVTIIAEAEYAKFVDVVRVKPGDQLCVNLDTPFRLMLDPIYSTIRNQLAQCVALVGKGNIVEHQ